MPEPKKLISTCPACGQADDERLLSLADIAAYIGCHKSTLYRLSPPLPEPDYRFGPQLLRWEPGTIAPWLRGFRILEGAERERRREIAGHVQAAIGATGRGKYQRMLRLVKEKRERGGERWSN